MASAVVSQDAWGEVSEDDPPSRGSSPLPQAHGQRSRDRPKLSQQVRKSNTCDMQGMMSVPEAAHRMTVSNQRVRALIASGGLEAFRLGGRWVVAESSVASWIRSQEGGVTSRPLSVRSIMVLVDLLSQHFGAHPAESWRNAKDHDRTRARARLQRLEQSENPGDVLRAWAGRHEDRRLLRYAGDVTEVVGGYLVGASDPRSGLAPGNYVELACTTDDAVTFVRDDLLHESANWNVILHVREDPDALGWLPFDLAAYGADREDAAIEALFR